MSEATVRKTRRRARLASNGWCSLNLASARSGMTRHSILVSAIAGLLTAQVIAGQVLILEESLERFIAQRDGEAVTGDVAAPTD